MGKYGKRVTISDDIFAYNIGIIGESGIGKSTMMKEVCEKVAGSDGYIALSVGKEDGYDTIEGANAEPVHTWKKFKAVIDDIIQNKSADYPNLRVVVIDTIDQLFEIAEPEVIRLHNIEAGGKKDGKITTSINAAFGGFGAGQDKAIELVLSALWSLKLENIAFAIIGHTKKRDIEDPVTGETYSTLTTNMQQRYFNAIKTKLHLLGVASIDREIVKEKTGKKNLVTKEDVVKGKVVSESRRITFRDDNYTIDSKSRFANIAPSIPLDSDAFIKAVKDAIAASKKPASSVVSNVSPEQSAQSQHEDEPDIGGTQIDGESLQQKNIQELLNGIRAKFKAAEREKKDHVKNNLLGGGKLSESIPVPVLREILAYLS